MSRRVRSLTTRMLLASAALAVIVAAIFLTMAQGVGSLRSAADHHSDADHVISEASLAERLLVDIESGSRGYLLTGQARFLESWRSGRRRLPAAAAELVRSTSDAPREHALASSIQAQSLAYIRDWAEPLIRMARSSPARARALVARGEGKRRVDALRARFTALIDSANAHTAKDEREAHDAADRAKAIALAGLGGVMLLALGYALYLTRSVALPTRRITEAADRYAAGDLAARAPPAGAGEVGELSRAFNAMADAVAVSHAESEQERARFAGVLAAATDYAITATGLDGVFTVFNQGAEQMLGYSAEEMIGRETPALIHDPAEIAARAQALGIEPSLEVMGGAARRGEPETREWTYIRKDGTRLPVLVSVTAMHGANGELTGYMGLATDLRERKRADAAVRRLSEERDLILSSAGVGIFRVDLDGRATYVNPEAARLIGYGVDEVVGKNLHALIHHTRPDGTPYPGEECPTYAAMSDGVLHHVDDDVFWTAAGESFPVECTSAPIYEDGEITGAVGIFSDIGERRRAQEETEEARAEAVAAREDAERANLAKSEFLSRMSHELRTPLNAILGFGQLLELDPLDEGQEESVRHIMRGGRHLLDLINEILDISRIEAGTLALSPEPVRIGDAVADVLSLVRPLAVEREVRLEHALTALDDSFVLADRQRLKQVLLNLLSNAIKYNRRGGTATVTLEEREARLCVAVSDEGAGIPPDRLERLFTPFERLGAEATGIEGTGLGLALSKRLVEAMKGTLTVESTPGAGSRFTVELPTSESPERRTRLRTPAEGYQRAGLPKLPAGKILYVEDNVSNVRLAESVLASQENVVLIPAMQGSIALDLARQHSPDLILLDLHLPDMGGTEVLERLKADPATAEIPVVVLSADATERQISRLLGKGARDYLTKPLDLERFFEVVAGALTAPG